MTQTVNHEQKRTEHTFKMSRDPPLPQCQSTLFFSHAMNPHVCEELNEAYSYALLTLLFMNVFKKKNDRYDTLTHKTGESGCI